MGKTEYSCEICGSPTNRPLFRLVEGVKMLVCPKCQHYGEKIKDERPHRKKGNLSYGPSVPYYGDVKKSKSKKTSYKPRKSAKFSSKKSAYQAKRKPRLDELELKPNYRTLLRKYRQKRKMTQAEFANSVGISEATYRSVEAKKVDLTIPEAQKIEKNCDIEILRIVSEDEEEYDLSEFSNKSDGFTLGDVFFKRKS
ncbi:MAG: helix-turn-helix domain-containing protein [Candidatus Lokiarchaeota archaeon]|nr:helix-turn-helix domain-containing protein [Candidatus Lokiarchaeota archaeon]